MKSSLDEWIAGAAISFSMDSPTAFAAAVSKLLGALGESTELLGLGEPMHGGEAFLQLRNLLFQRLVEAHGFTAIAVESSFPRSRVVNNYVGGSGAATYDEVGEVGFSHGFGELEANRELVEWMRSFNGDPSHGVKLRFYGFDSPTEMMNSDSPRRLIQVAVEYLAAIDAASGQALRECIECYIGPDADWENPDANMDPTKSIGLSPNAAALRIAVEDLVSELRTRQPELVAASDESRYLEAVHYASSARHLLNYHAAVARPSTRRLVDLLGIRDLMMADNLAYIVERERRQPSTCSTIGGRVLAFAHNSHLKRGQAAWQWGPQLLSWWPAGAHLVEMLGPRYAVIGTGVGVSMENGIGQPEAGTLEARLIASRGPGRFLATHLGQDLPASEIAALPTRSSSAKNPSYFPLTPQSFTDFDWLAVLDATTYNRGGRPLG